MICVAGVAATLRLEEIVGDYSLKLCVQPIKTLSRAQPDVLLKDACRAFVHVPSQPALRLRGNIRKFLIARFAKC